MFILLTYKLEISQNHFETPIFISNHHKQNYVQVHLEHWRAHLCLGQNSFIKFFLKTYKLKKLQNSFFSQLFFRWLHPYCNSLVCLAVFCFIHRDHTQKHLKLHYRFFRPAYLKTQHTCNVHKPYGYMTWVVVKNGSLSLIRWW